MNKQFVKKMVQAKQLEYQALKEVMPEKLAKRVTKLEGELMDFGKEIFMTVLQTETNEDKNTASDAKPKTRKVTIE